MMKGYDRDEALAFILARIHAKDHPELADQMETALKLAGVDMSSPEPVRNALKIFKETIDQLKALKA